MVPTVGAESIVSTLFRTHAAKVRCFLGHRLRNADEASDATQEIFIKLWRYETGGRLREDAAQYMYAAMHSMAIDVDRRRALHASRTGDEVDPAEALATVNGEDT